VAKILAPLRAPTVSTSSSTRAPWIGARSQIPARGLASQIFAAAPGVAVTDIRADGQAILVAVVEEINRPAIAEHPQEVEALRIQMEESVLSSLGAALQDEIAARISPRRNERLIASTYRATNAEGEEQTQ
jgi:hypothetical protein